MVHDAASVSVLLYLLRVIPYIDSQRVSEKKDFPPWHSEKYGIIESMKDKPTQFTSMAQKRRFEAAQREIERVRDEKKERENNADNQSRQSPGGSSGVHPSGAW